MGVKWLGAFLAVGLISGCAIREPGVPSANRIDEAVRLQIFLDSQQFGPGVVDGRPGEFTEKALIFFNKSRGLPAESKPDLSLIEPYTSYQVTSGDIAAIGSMAVEPADIAKQKQMPYVSLSELLAERFHTTQLFLAELNRGVAIDALADGAVIKVPNVRRPFRADRFPSTYQPPGGIALVNRRVVVDTGNRMLQVRDGERLIAAFPITPGSTEHPAPVGDWKILGVVPWPWYRYDEGVLKRGERTESFHLFPPGPNSPVGVVWAGLNRPGVGIHGTSSPDTIGRSGSHGCVRLSNWDAATFYTLVGKGVAVTIY